MELQPHQFGGMNGGTQNSAPKQGSPSTTTDIKVTGSAPVVTTRTS